MILETVITGITAIAVAYLGSEQYKTRKHAKDTAETTAVVKEQVKNSHETNLRDDVDRVIDRLDVILAGVTQLGEDISIERRERMALGDRLENHTH